MWDNQKWYQLFEGVILIARCVHFDIWDKIQIKFFFLVYQNSYGGVYEIFLAGNFFEKFLKKFFFSYFSPNIKMYALGDKKYAFKKFPNFFQKISQQKNFISSPTWNFGGWEKIFFSILFHISKCTHWAIKMTPSKSWYHLWLSHNNGLFL